MKKIKNDFEIIYIYVKHYKITYLFSIFFIYFFIFPYLLYMTFHQETIKEIIFYENSQKYLLIMTLFILSTFIKSYIEGHMKELIYVYDQKYKIRFVIEIYFLLIILLLPMFIISLYLFSHIFYYIIWFCFQILIIYVLFYCISLLFHSVLISFVIIFCYYGYMIFFVQNPYFFNLYRSFGFYDTSIFYFVFWIFVMIGSILVSINLENRDYT